jgi:hypothetical protein
VLKEVKKKAGTKKKQHIGGKQEKVVEEESGK